MDKKLVQVVYLIRDSSMNLFLDADDLLGDIGPDTAVFHTREGAKAKIVELECEDQERNEDLEIIQLLV